jgi:hypothetical protein
MRFLALALLLAGCGGGAATAPAGDLDQALDAVARGDLDEAEKMVRSGQGHEATRLHARILMMRNRNREAIDRLLPLLQGKLKDYEAMERRQHVYPDLALAYVRQDNFQSAARLYAQLGESVLAKKYEALSKEVAYSSVLPDNDVAIEFHVTDPLPIVAGTVNGRRALFVVDTLLDEVVLDRSFARAALGVESFAKEMTVGRAVVKNVPVQFGEAAPVGTLRPDGAIGLQFLMHFDFTLDYRRSRLVLRKAGGTIPGQPAYLVGDRYLLTQGLVNGKDKAFVGIGTSLKGVTLAASDLVVQALGGEVRDFAAGPIKLVKPALDPKGFPMGLEGQFGVPVGFVLGHAALRGRVLRLEPRSMKLAIE